MPLFKLSDTGIERVPDTSFGNEGLRERSDLQTNIRDHVDIVAPDTLLLAEEYGQWEDSRRRIDLLAIDKAANLVVIELKRTVDGGHMDLQAVRYAAMVSNMTFDQAVEAHAAYLSRRGRDANARERILGFLGWEDPEENDFAQEVRIVLASAEFSKELTTSVLWLRDHDIEISCVRLRPYRVEGTILINAEQVIPLPEAEDYQVKVREKTRVERAERKHGRDYTKYDVSIDGETYPRLPKRQAILQIVKALTSKGVPVKEIDDLIDWRKSEKLWLAVDGEVETGDFLSAAALAAERSGLALDPGRWFSGEGELIRQDGRTYALTNQWGIRTAQAMRLLVEAFPDKGVSFAKSE